MKAQPSIPRARQQMAHSPAAGMLDAAAHQDTCTTPWRTGRLQQGSNGVWVANRRYDVSHPEHCQDWYLAVEDRSYWFRHRARCIVQMVRLFPPAGPIWDVGGGNGHVSLALQQAGVETILLEPSFQAASHARARGVRTVICATLEDMELPAASVAAMAAFDVLEHIEDDVAMLRTMCRMLQPAGRLYLTVPAHNWLWSPYDEMVGHWRRYTTASLSKRLHQAGFAVELASYLYSFLPLPILLLRSLPGRLRRRRGKDQDRQRFEREHAAAGGPVSWLAERLLRVEQALLARRKTIPFGSSCLIVARRAAAGTGSEEKRLAAPADSHLSARAA